MQKNTLKDSRAMLTVVGLFIVGMMLGVSCLPAERSSAPTALPSQPSSPQQTDLPLSRPMSSAKPASMGDYTPALSPTRQIFLSMVAVEQSLVTPLVSPTPPVQPLVHYGVLYPYKNTWTEADRPAIRERLAYLRGLGVDVVVQVFSSELVDTGQEQGWFIFLDEAHAQNIQVIARLWRPRDWDGTRFNFQYVGRFLSVIKDHPALLAYFGLHEPLEEFTSVQLRAYYKSVKAYAPRVPIFHAMSSMAAFDADPRFPGRRFTDGICDLCGIWYYPFRLQNGKPVFDRQKVREVVTSNDALVRARDPDAQIWFLAQAYAMAQHSPPLRMPSTQEMDSLAAMLLEDPLIDGFLWYPWSHSSYDQVLGDPASDPQQRAVGDIYELYLKDGASPPPD